MYKMDRKSAFPMKTPNINRIKLITRSVRRLSYSLYDFFRFDVKKALGLYFWYFLSLYRYVTKAISSGDMGEIELYPCLHDNISYTPVEPTYFFQNIWAADLIFRLKPRYIVDIGSPISFIGVISQFTKVFFVDIRPPKIKAQGLEYIKGDLTSLPFKDNSIGFISSLCVIEHVGLGRYRDNLDPKGTEKAMREISRVLRREGIALISLHIDERNKVYFNAHRAFDVGYIYGLIEKLGMEIKDERYLYYDDNQLHRSYIREKGFGTAYLCLKKK